ncbi:MAG: DUF3793 family protein [Clostridia bacterium]|nr:DUF3793 family protein [Clostridia bacterium]
MSEQMLIRHCSPTLAGIKTGNLFSCGYASDVEMREILRSFNRRFRGKGLRVLPVRYRDGRALIYVYRPTRLEKDLCDRNARDILRAHGYGNVHPSRCLARLIDRLGEGEEFPHEIGLFLGYPPADVDGFIREKTCGGETGACKCVGQWRVYGDESSARRLFEKYKKCTAVYDSCWKKGVSLERLTVSG